MTKPQSEQKQHGAMLELGNKYNQAPSIVYSLWDQTLCRRVTDCEDMVWNWGIGKYEIKLWKRFDPWLPGGVCSAQQDGNTGGLNLTSYGYVLLTPAYSVPIHNTLASQTILAIGWTSNSGFYYTTKSGCRSILFTGRAADYLLSDLRGDEHDHSPIKLLQTCLLFNVSYLNILYKQSLPIYVATYIK